MALSSITGFARADGTAGAYVWAWELKSVNAKGLELRLRTPHGWDAVEAPLRAKAAEALARGTVHANLTVQRAGVAPVVRARTQVVYGVGNPNADLMFIGEAPGRDEDIKGEPFVGRAGQLLSKIIEATNR